MLESISTPSQIRYKLEADKVLFYAGTLRSIYLSLVIVWLILSPNTLIAQEQTTFELAAFISQLERREQVKFSYVDADLEELKIRIPASTLLPDILKSISQQTGIEIKKLNERYYALSKTKVVEICGRILDNYANNTIPGATIEVLGTDIAFL